MTDLTPAKWITARADTVCDKIQDGTHFSPKVQLAAGEYPYVTAKNVRPSGLDLSNLTYLRPEDHAQIFRRADVRQGDVLLVKDGVNAGDAAINTVSGEISLLSSVCFLRPRGDVLRAGFLRYFLQSPRGDAALTGRLSGTAIRRIILQRVRELDVPVAPMAEQQRIVEAIESYLTRLDNAVTLLERVEENLKRYRASVLKAAVEGRLVPTEAELARREGRSYEPASELLKRILAERKTRWIEDAVDKARARGVTDEAGLTQARKRAEKKCKEPEPPDTSDLPDLPEGWCWTTVDCLSSYVTSGSRGWAKYYSEAGAVFLRIGDLSRSSLTPEIGKAQRVELPSTVEGLRTSLIAGDIVISITADLGIIGVIPTNAGEAYVNQHIALVRPVEVSTSNYVGSYLTSELGQRELRRLDRGVTKAGLGLDDIRATRVAFPPADEMRRIVDQVERATSLVAANVEASKKIKRQVTSLRQSILKWAFEGKLVEQDPNDEPASALLARIQASGRRMSGRRRAR